MYAIQILHKNPPSIYKIGSARLSNKRLVAQSPATDGSINQGISLKILLLLDLNLEHHSFFLIQQVSYLWRKIQFLVQTQYCQKLFLFIRCLWYRVQPMFCCSKCVNLNQIFNKFILSFFMVSNHKLNCRGSYKHSVSINLDFFLEISRFHYFTCLFNRVF